jgi:2-methylcitrate dehydratase PrpD
MSLTRELSEIVAATRFEDLPAEAVDIAAQVLLDSIGTTIAGANEPGGLGRITIEYTKRLGGPDHAGVIGSGFKTSVLNAAYANGTLCHALDYDPTWWPRNHPASPSIPAILAIAERDHLPGADVALAIVLAFEVQGRMRVASSGLKSGGTFHHPGISGTMGGTTGAGVALKLNADQFCMAYGIAGSRTGSLTANHGTMTKPSHSGHAARMGVDAAMLASLGFTASDDIFGAGNYFDTFYGPGNSKPELLVKDFADPYRMISPGVSIKRYPAKYATHRTIEGAADLAKKHDLKPEQIASVEVEFTPTKLVDRPKPRSGLDGKFSMQYAAAIGLLDRSATIPSYSNERRFAPDMEALLPKISLKENATIPADFPETWTIVRVKTTDGRLLEEKCAKLRGMQGVPLPRAERLEKFYGCVVPTLTKGQADEVVALVEGLADLDNLDTLMSILVSPAVFDKAAE